MAGDANRSRSCAIDGEVGRVSGDIIHIEQRTGTGKQSITTICLNSWHRAPLVVVVSLDG